MNQARVLVVDDSSTVRQVLSTAISADRRFRVVGTASTGREALRRVDELRPDVMTLDVEMPELDGPSTLRALRKVHPGLPVLMVSSLNRSSVAAALDASGLGAVEFLAKPSGGTAFAQELCDRLAELTARRDPGRAPTLVPPPPPRGRRARAIRLVVIASSTGGPDAVARLLSQLPRPFPLPIAIVQHMPPVFTTMFAQRLAGASHLVVTEATEGAELLPGRVLVAPGDHHLRVVTRGTALVAQLDKGPLENSCRPAADVLFRTAAAAVRGEVLAVVLTGLGRDGAAGCRAVADAGGRVLVQDRLTSVAWGMPGAVVEAGLADQVLPLDGLASAVTTAALGRELAAT